MDDKEKVMSTVMRWNLPGGVHTRLRKARLVVLQAGSLALQVSKGFVQTSLATA